MNRIWHLVFIGTLALVQARPEEGYKYPQPQHQLNLNQNQFSSSHQQTIPQISLSASQLSSQYGVPNLNIGLSGQNIQQLHGQEQTQYQTIPQINLPASQLSSQYGVPNLNIGQSSQNILQLHGQEQNQFQQSIPQINLPASQLSSQYGVPHLNIGQSSQNIQQLHGQEQNQFQQTLPQINLPALQLSSQYGVPNLNIGQSGQSIQQLHGQVQNQLSTANLQESQNSFSSQESIPNLQTLPQINLPALQLSSQYGVPNLNIGQSGQGIQQLHGQVQNQLSTANLQESQNSFSSQQSIPNFQQLSSQKPNQILSPNLQVSQNSFSQQTVPQSQSFFSNIGSQSTLNQFDGQPGINQFNNQPSFNQFNDQSSFNQFNNQPGISQLSQHQVLSSQEQIPSVTKYIYVHVAPEDPPAQLPVIPGPLPPKKNYKIIFIKAPRSSSQQPVVHLPQAQQTVEEKTLIYVLVDKQHQQQIIVPTPAPTEPSKPEVYFIKYKAKNAGNSNNFGQQPSLPIVEDLKKNQGVPINSGESTSSLFSGGLPGPSSKYGPPGYQKRSTKNE